MKNAELNIVLFEGNDVIATSGLYQMSGTDDWTEGNIEFDGLGASNFRTIYGATSFFNGSLPLTGENLYNSDQGGEAEEFDGYYKWDAGNNRYVRQ